MQKVHLRLGVCSRVAWPVMDSREITSPSYMARWPKIARYTVIQKQYVNRLAGAVCGSIWPKTARGHVELFPAPCQHRGVKTWEPALTHPITQERQMRLRFRIGKLTLKEFGNQTQGAHPSRQAYCLCLSELNAGQRTEQGIDLLVSSVRVCISVRLSVRPSVCLFVYISACIRANVCKRLFV